MKILIKSLVIFCLISASFLFPSCSPGKLFLWTSNGIMTYNRHSGQFELLWDNNINSTKVIRDTVYVIRDSFSKQSNTNK